MNFYKHHLGDYDGHTAHLSWDEDMAYTRLMRAYYRREVPIPDAERHRLTRATTAAQRKAVDSVLGEFFRLEDGAWHNKRCDEEIAAYQAQANTNRRIARQREDKRTVNEPFDEPLTNRSPVYMVEREPNQIPDTRYQIKANAGNAPNGARPAPQDSEIVITLPLREGGEFPVSRVLVSELEPLYPAVDVPQTLREMKGWLVGNPERRKTRKGARRFIVNWLQSEQEKCANGR